MKNILGLDLGTNSIGWAVIKADDNGSPTKIERIGSRIIPMSKDVLFKFDNGQPISQTAIRTALRGVRRSRERQLLRRERLHRVLHVLNFLPKHYESSIGWNKNDNKTFGKFFVDIEPKLAWLKKDKQSFEFIFSESYEEMLNDFRKYYPSLRKENGELLRIPHDWTLYYLRKKALTQPIKKEELSWIILNFNQKRGSYQLRREKTENDPNKQIEYHALEVVFVTAEENIDGKENVWYNLVLKNGWVCRRLSKVPLFDWVGKVKEFIVVTEINSDGTTKTDENGVEKRTFKIPSEDDWELLKKKTETDIDRSSKTVGCYIYDALIQNPDVKIRGRLVATIDRDFYKQELISILTKQKEYHVELQNSSLYKSCIKELYPKNVAHQNNLYEKDFTYLFIEDILFYQRPLKSKKSLIRDCPYENYIFYKGGEKKEEPLKCIAKSNPLFQEFRLWQFIQNLRILERYKEVNGKMQVEVDVTGQFLPSIRSYILLYEWLNDRKDVRQEVLLQSFFGIKRRKGYDDFAYRWNYVEDKEFPCNETRSLILSRLSKCKINRSFLTTDVEMSLWHILYSVKDKQELVKALRTFSVKHSLNEEFVHVFKEFPPFKKEYGSYSEKAIKKLLPLMRIGKYWKEDAIHLDTIKRIDKILTGEYDKTIHDRVREKAINLSDINHFSGLPLWLASYVVYDRHSEAGKLQKWKSPMDIENFLRYEFKSHSLRNPVVEQIIIETLHIVKDLWINYGNFDEIHVELGRKMKNPSYKRAQITQQITENENRNLRIKHLLRELQSDSSVENVRAHSLRQQEILKIFEDGILTTAQTIPADINRIRKKSQPSKLELIVYRDWLENKYYSPYTGKIIPLSKLFTTAYEIDHIIPQSRYYDETLNNKVICEAEINTLKGDQLGYEFVKLNESRLVELASGKRVRVLPLRRYEVFIKTFYGKNRKKAEKLLFENIPDTFIERQLNDTRYISTVIKGLLSNIVREEDEQNLTSKNVIICTGGITSVLKRDWEINEAWDRVIQSRFERLNKITQSSLFGEWKDKSFRINIPLEYQKGINKKRIDHRHHAMDALIIACATRDHVTYLNNTVALKGYSMIRVNLRNKLYQKEKQKEYGVYKWALKKPWRTFVSDVQLALENTLVSFKQNIRVINKTINKTECYVDNGVKTFKIQSKGDSWAIRRSLHKDTVYGKVVLRKYKTPMAAVRKPLTIISDVRMIQTITDESIQNIVWKHLEKKENNLKWAFSPEGIDEMNENIKLLNNGINHKPIYRVRIFEPIGHKFKIGIHHCKKHKYVEAAIGSNLFFAVYQSKGGKRSFETVPLSVIIERQKQGLSPIIEKKGSYKLLFGLSPNDLVYVPTKKEQKRPSLVNLKRLTPEQKKRIYKFVSCTDGEGHFVPNTYAYPIIKNEIGSNNKSERILDYENSNDNNLEKSIQIKACCWKLKTNRLGDVIDRY